jgi:polysaccharide biosynthesis protein PelC
MNLHKAIRQLRVGAILLLILTVSACSTLEHSPAVSLDRKATWVILPVSNHSDTPQAGLRLESLLENQLRSQGVDAVQRYPAEIGADLLLDPREIKAQEQARQWARTRGARYGITGAVNEWRYKVGVDGEPAVGVTLQIISIEDGKVLYSASGARTGWSREALSAVAQKLTREMLTGAGL